MFVRFIVRAAFAALGLWVAARVFHVVYIDNNVTLLVAAVLLGVVNAFVRPVVFVLTLPVTILTLGVFLLVVNAAMVGLVSWLLPGMAVHGLINACAAAIITGVASWIGHMALRDDRSYRY